MAPVEASRAKAETKPVALEERERVPVIRYLGWAGAVKLAREEMVMVLVEFEVGRENLTSSAQ